jgi:hypothetical protein
VYDIATKIPVSSNINMDFTYKMNAQGTSIVGTVKGITLTGMQITNK